MLQSKIQSGNKKLLKFYSEKFILERPGKKIDFHSDWSKLMLVVDKIERIAETHIEISNYAHLAWWYSTNKVTVFSPGAGGGGGGREPRTPFGSSGGNLYTRTVYFYNPPAKRCKPNVESKILATWLCCVLFVEWYNKTVLTKKKVRYRD